MGRETPVKTDSFAKITSLGALDENYIELGTGTKDAPLAASRSEVMSGETVGIGAIGDMLGNLALKEVVAWLGQYFSITLAKEEAKRQCRRGALYCRRCPTNLQVVKLIFKSTFSILNRCNRHYYQYA